MFYKDLELNISFYKLISSSIVNKDIYLYHYYQIEKIYDFE